MAAKIIFWRCHDFCSDLNIFMFTDDSCWIWTVYVLRFIVFINLFLISWVEGNQTYHFHVYIYVSAQICQRLTSMWNLMRQKQHGYPMMLLFFHRKLENCSYLLWYMMGGEIEFMLYCLNSSILNPLLLLLCINAWQMDYPSPSDDKVPCSFIYLL